MISKERFIYIMESLQEATKLQNDINELVKNARDNIRNDFENGFSIMISHEDIVVELLEKMFNTDLISWWIYDTNYGTQYATIYERYDGCKLVDNKEYLIDTPARLYDYIVNMKNEGEFMTWRR